jgi:hypothetical protein
MQRVADVVYVRSRQHARRATRHGKAERLVDHQVVQLTVHLLTFGGVWFCRGLIDELHVRIGLEAGVVPRRVEQTARGEVRDRFKLAVGPIVDGYTNVFGIVGLIKPDGKVELLDVQFDADSGEISLINLAELVELVVDRRDDAVDLNGRRVCLLESAS